MFGNNPLLKANYSSDRWLDVFSIFPTIQGEGPYSGQPAVFIRLFGCNLKCHWCDTDFMSERDEMSVDEVVANVVGCGIAYNINFNLVVITGGEPMRQNITPLCNDLLAEGFRVQIETAGTLVPPGFIALKESNPRRLSVVCSPKTPRINKHLEPHVDVWKYIIRDGEVGEDGLPTHSTQCPGKISPVQRPTNNAEVFVHPMDEQDEAKNKANTAAALKSAMSFRYRIGLQIHKLIGVE